MDSPAVLAFRPCFIGSDHRQRLDVSDKRAKNECPPWKCAEKPIRARCGGRPTGFHNLPREVLVRIFSYFPEEEIAGVLMHVCQHWRLAATHPSLWCRLRFQGASLPARDICRLLHHSACLTSLQLVAVPGPSVVRALRQVCRCNPLLQHITVKRCMREDECIPDSVLKNLVVSCRELLSINFKGTQIRTRRLVSELVYAPQLRSLKLSLQASSRPRDLLLAALNCRDLSELVVSPCRARGGPPPLADTDACLLFHALRPSLAALSFDAHGLCEPALQAILSCSLLRSLKLTNCVQLSGALFRSLPRRLPGLARLRLANACQLTSEDVAGAFAEPGSPLRRLSYLDLAGCWRLRDEGLLVVAEAAGGTLMHVGLERCKSVTRAGVAGLLGACRHLRHLNVAHAFEFRCEDARAVHRLAPGLERLVLGQYEPAAATELGQLLPGLRIAVKVSEFSKEKYDFFL
ncbi:uncharacterized protein LOC134541790 [Bacillus rossius redtenbacheri]|uniref:uncharacterized protein LOC134541790 n=1 Tax=Bacillus rossius redtenbacheri TaxID=93214 RepID=UPI002FDC91F6